VADFFDRPLNFLGKELPHRHIPRNGANDARTFNLSPADLITGLAAALLVGESDRIVLLKQLSALLVCVSKLSKLSAHLVSPLFFLRRILIDVADIGEIVQVQGSLPQLLGVFQHHQLH